MSMPTSRFAGVSRAARALLGSSGHDALALTVAEEIPPVAAAADAPVADPPEPAPDEDDKDPPEPAPEPEAAAAAAAAPALSGDEAIRADERARVKTVFASEHATGRERQAADMLQTSMSADEITGLLAKSPKGGAAADPMLAALASNKNPELGAGAETKTAAQSADDIWDRARASTKR